MNTVEGPRDLTQLQRKQLSMFREHCENPPTTATLFLTSLRAHVVLVLLLVANCALFIAFDHEAWVMPLVAFTAGFFVHTWLRWQMYIGLWPALEAVINRDRLEQLLNEHTDDGY
jgi:hypothetical protein